MTKEIIETSKGMFVVKYLRFIPLDCNGIKLSEITEEQASEIVNNVNDKMYIRYSDFTRRCKTAIESLHSLLESKGIKITNNTYIFSYDNRNN